MTLAPICSLGDVGSTYAVAGFSTLAIHASATDPEDRLQRMELWVNGELP